MVVCSLCRHPQAGGDECEICGNPLEIAPAAEPAVEGLEPTGHAPVDVSSRMLEGIERTHHAPVGDPTDRADRTPDLEPTRAAPVDVEVVAFPGLEPTSVAREAETSSLEFLATPVCRYCRTPAAPGERMCGRCGMRLQVFEGSRPEPQAEASLCSCGAPVSGSLCPNCGARRPSS